MAERFENLDDILRDWVKEKISKNLDDALNRYEKQEEEKRPFLFEEMAQKKYSSSLSRQSSKIKSKTNWSPN